jgi:hypothetical protein
MIGTVRFHRYPVLLPRAPARQGDPLSSRQSMDLTLAQMIRRPFPTTPLPTAIRRLCLSGGVDRPAIIHLAIERPG